MRSSLCKMFAVAVSAVFLLSGAEVSAQNTFTDPRDGKKYRTVRIGNQTWMAENLNHEMSNSWCYGDNLENCNKYGRLYNWDAAMKACPAGWHLPNRQEWRDLATANGDGRSYWYPTHELNFSSSRGGGRFDDNFSDLGSIGSWWTSTAKGSSARYRTFNIYNWTIYPNGSMDEDSRDKNIGYSVRCLLGEMESIEPIIGTFTDTRDGKKYRTAEIGSQIWMAQNLNYRIGQSWCYDNKDSNCAKYGRLYDWNTAMKACPAGWHLPSREEWDKLTNLSDAGTKLKSKSPNWDGMDDFGFSALPAGLRRTDGTFYGVGAMDYWWTATGDEEYDDNAHTILMDAGITDAGGLNVSKKYGYSVRCVQKKTQEETTKQQTTQQQPQPQQTSSSTLTSRSQESIQRTMNGKMVGFQYAYNVRRNNKPDLSGKITVKFAINESGKVIFVQMVESTMNDPEFEKTIVDGIRDFQFEKIGKPNDVQETAFLFNFSPQQQVQAQQQQTGNSALTGGRSRASIQSVVMQHMAALRHAFNRRLRDKPGLSGKIAVKFAINEFGSVISASVVESTMNDPELEKVVVEKVKSFQFEKIDKPGDVTDVTYPFVFSE